MWLEAARIIGQKYFIAHQPNHGWTFKEKTWINHLGLPTAMCTLTGPSLESPKKCRSKNKISYKHPWRHACLRPSQKPPSIFSSFPVSPKAPSKVHRGHSTPALHWHPVEAQNNPKPRLACGWTSQWTLCQQKTLRTWHAWPDDLGFWAHF